MRRAGHRGDRPRNDRRSRASAEAIFEPDRLVPHIVPKEDIIPLYTLATLFVCPSVYEPFGIINLEAMACGTPVVASAVGGIKEVVVSGKTGTLIPFEAVSHTDLSLRTPIASRGISPAVNELLATRTSSRNGRTLTRTSGALLCWKSVARWTCDYWDSGAGVAPVGSQSGGQALPSQLWVARQGLAPQPKCGTLLMLNGLRGVLARGKVLLQSSAAV